MPRLSRGFKLKKTTLYKLYALIVAALLIGFDQLTKWLVSTSPIKLGETLSLIKIGNTEVLNLTHHHNTGASFGIFQGKTTMLVIVTLLIQIGLIAYVVIKKNLSKSALWALTLIISGGFGNMIDRVFKDGKVVDFIDFRFIQFPIFNVADICVVVGSALLIISIIIEEVNLRKAEKIKENADKNDN